MIQYYGGFVSQHLDDGLLAYFGYQAAHENSAQQAARAGKEIIQSLQQQFFSLPQEAVRKSLPNPPLAKEGTQMPLLGRELCGNRHQGEVSVTV